MTYNPYCVVDIHANDTFLESGDDKRLVNAFGSTVIQANSFIYYCLPKEWTQASIVGVSNLGGDAQAQSQPRATIGFWGRFIPM